MNNIDNFTFYKSNGSKPHRDPECRICGKVLNDSNTFKYHMQLRTTHLPNLLCNECGNMTYKARTSSLHFLKCEICGKSYGTLKTLHRHIRSHIGEEPFRCEVCGIAFLYSNSLRMHKSYTGHSIKLDAHELNSVTANVLADRAVKEGEVTKN